MKLDIKFRFDIYTFLMILVLTMLIGLTYKGIVNIASEKIRLNQLIEENKAYIFDYSCDSGFDSKYYNCFTNESFRNITGLYCNDKLICENKIRRIK